MTDPLVAGAVSGKGGKEKGGKMGRTDTVDLQAPAAELKRRVTSLFEQITRGCGYPDCQNPYCASSLKRCAEINTADHTAAAALALRLASQQAPPFCAVRGYARPLSIAELRALIAASRSSGTATPAIRRIGEVFGSPESLRTSFLPTATATTLLLSEACLVEFGAAELDQVREAYKLIDAAKLSDVVNGGLRCLAEALSVRSPLRNDPATLRAVAFAFECPLISDPGILGPLAQVVAMMPEKSRAVLANMWANAFAPLDLRSLVITIQSAISTHVLFARESRSRRSSPNSDSFVISCVVLLDALHKSCTAMENKPLALSAPPMAAPSTSSPSSTMTTTTPVMTPQPVMGFREWYNTVLCEAIDIRIDYNAWKFKKSASDFSFCRFPFLLAPAYKAELLKIESLLEQHR
jgi:hypothetical protein